MEIKEIMKVLEEDIGLAIISSVDENKQPDARPINIGVANENGVFFMTSPKSNFYSQITNDPNIAVTGVLQEDKKLQVIRITGKVRALGKEKLEEILEDNPYVEQVFPKESDQKSVQAFQLYEGEGFYHDYIQNKRHDFEIKQ